MAGRQNRNRHGLRDGQRAESDFLACMTWPSGSAGGDGEQSGCSQYTGTAGRIENAQVAVYLTTPTATRS